MSNGKPPIYILYEEDAYADNDRKKVVCVVADLETSIEWEVSSHGSIIRTSVQSSFVATADDIPGYGQERKMIRQKELDELRRLMAKYPRGLES